MVLTLPVEDENWSRFCDRCQTVLPHTIYCVRIETDEEDRLDLCALCMKWMVSYGQVGVHVTHERDHEHVKSCVMHVWHQQVPGSATMSASCQLPEFPVFAAIVESNRLHRGRPMRYVSNGCMDAWMPFKYSAGRRSLSKLADGICDALQVQQHADVGSHHSSKRKISSERTTQEGPLFSPSAEELRPDHPGFRKNLRMFLEEWRAGRPVVVRGVRGQTAWTPEAVGKAAGKATSVDVESCSSGEAKSTPCKTFFKKKNERWFFAQSLDPSAELQRVRDWPPEGRFRESIGPLYDDFVGSMLPLPFMTSPEVQGDAFSANLAHSVPSSQENQTDLGPKTYIAQGRQEEHPVGDGDSVAKLHRDLSSAVNCMLHVVATQEDANADTVVGALWDVFRCVSYSYPWLCRAPL